ncbi:MAG TPA: hypothetical protein VKF36_02555, partial [Syntrophorhabdales bacterium]|nr:hypothetical protein [Syntrophorhabdales bacterium]
EEYINDDSKESSRRSESYDLITDMKEKAGRKNLCKTFVVDFSHRRKEQTKFIVRDFSKSLLRKNRRLHILLFAGAYSGNLMITGWNKAESRAGWPCLR